MKKNNVNGFTLTEVISVIAIGLIITLAVYEVFLMSQKAFGQAEANLELTQNARIFLDRVTREIRQSDAIASSLPPTKITEGFPPASELMFQDGHDVPDIQYLRYYLDGGLVKRQRIVYFFDAEPLVYVPFNAEDEFGDPPSSQVMDEKIIAEYASELKFYGDKTTYIEIFLDKNAVSAHFYTGVWGRNTRL